MLCGSWLASVLAISDLPLEAAPKTLLLALYSDCIRNKDSKLYIHQENFAKKLGCSRTTVRRSLNNLVKAGFVLECSHSKLFERKTYEVRALISMFSERLKETEPKPEIEAKPEPEPKPKARRERLSWYINLRTDPKEKAVIDYEEEEILKIYEQHKDYWGKAYPFFGKYGNLPIVDYLLEQVHMYRIFPEYKNTSVAECVDLVLNDTKKIVKMGYEYFYLERGEIPPSVPGEYVYQGPTPEEYRAKEKAEREKASSADFQLT